MKKSKEKVCLMCGQEFQRSTRFMAVCSRCAREQDNQTLEAILSVPGNLLEGQTAPHQANCAHWAGYTCDCEGDGLDPVALNFHEAVND